MRIYTARLISVFVLYLISVATAFADHDEADIGEILVQLEENRRMIVAENMLLDSDGANEFWRVYDKYRGEMSELGHKGFALLREFQAHFDELSDERALFVMTTYLDLQREELDVRERYIEEFNAVVPAKQTLRLYQIDNKVDAIIQSDISSVTPLVP